MGSDKVQKAFDAFDTDGSGELDLDEFREAITSLGMTLSDKQFSEVRCCCLLFVVCCCCLLSCIIHESSHSHLFTFVLFVYFFSLKNFCYS